MENDFGTNNKNIEMKKKPSYFQGVAAGSFITVVVIALIAAILIGTGYISLDGLRYSNTKEGEAIGTAVKEKLNRLEGVLEAFYFDDVDQKIIEDNIYKAYVSAFNDRYTTYYPAEEYKEITQSTEGTYFGIGVVVSQNEDGTVKVVLPYPNCPGSEAGLKAGDAITKVNGESVIGRDLSSIVADIKGEEGTKVNVEVVREGVAAPFLLDIERRKIEIPTVESKMLEDDIGLILLTEFNEVTTEQFMKAYDDLTAQGMKGLVIDIRYNPGGLLNIVIEILDELVPDGMIVYTEDKNGKREEYKGRNENEIQIPLAVLVNGDSASASEIFAGTVQDYGVGVIVGTTTFGKGIVQRITPLADGSAVKYTISKYFTGKGQDVHGKGVVPDVVIEQSSETEDDQLQKALEIIKSKIK